MYHYQYCIFHCNIITDYAVSFSINFVWMVSAHVINVYAVNHSVTTVSPLLVRLVTTIGWLLVLRPIPLQSTTKWPDPGHPRSVY